TTGPGFSFQVFGSKGWLRLEGVTHVAGAASEERRTRLFGTCKFQPVKGEAKTWQAATMDISRAALDAFAKAAGGGPAFPIPYDQMIHGVAVTEAIVRSAGSGTGEKVNQIGITPWIWARGWATSAIFCYCLPATIGSRCGRA